MLVKAILPGYYQNKRRKPGQTFTISDRVHPKGTIIGRVVRDGKVLNEGKDMSGKVAEFSEVWMEKVEDKKPSAPQVTPPQGPVTPGSQKDAGDVI